jgi:predicted nucleic acid-binding protein
MILDAGALIALERNDRAMIARLVAAHAADDDLRSNPMVIAQVWRGTRRQANLARLLAMIDVIPIDDTLGRRCGELLAKTSTADPIDASVVLTAVDGETIVTSDVDDIQQLARAARRRVLVVGC